MIYYLRIKGKGFSFDDLSQFDLKLLQYLTRVIENSKVTHFMLDFNTSIGFEEEKTFCKNPTLNEDETKHFFI